MRDAQEDYELFVRWRNEPHVAEWWNTDDDPVPMTLEHAKAEQGPDADAWVTRCMISVADRPVGYVQFYPWSEEAGEARGMGVPDPDTSYGLDIFIGEPDMIGRGVGATVVALVARHVFETEGAASVALLTPVGNNRAHRAYEKAGFRKVRQTLDTDVVDGERRMSWLMVLDRPLGRPSWEPALRAPCPRPRRTSTGT
jgi:aminoglycoside 6'-N-acetyltransferase